MAAIAEDDRWPPAVARRPIGVDDGIRNLRAVRACGERIFVAHLRIHARWRRTNPHIAHGCARSAHLVPTARIAIRCHLDGERALGGVAVQSDDDIGFRERDLSEQVPGVVQVLDEHLCSPALGDVDAAPVREDSGAKTGVVRRDRLHRRRGHTIAD